MRYIIGIDPGTKTGFAMYDLQEQCWKVYTTKIHLAMRWVHQASQEGCMVIVEDARKRKWYGQNAAEKMKGAGSVSRDCTIWDDYLKDCEIPYRMVHPIKGGTKQNAERLIQSIGYKGRTSEHARDAMVLTWMELKKYEEEQRNKGMGNPQGGGPDRG